MLLLGININSGHRPRGYPLPYMRGNVWRCIAMWGLLVLAGCSSCAHRQPIGVLCSGMSEGTGFSKGMSEGPASMSQSQAIKYSRVICKLYYTEKELDRAIDSHVKQ